MTTRVCHAAVAFLLALLLADATGAAGVQDEQEQEEQQPQVETRVYSLRPLVAEARRSAASEAASRIRLDLLMVPSGHTAPFAGEPNPAPDAGEIVTQVTNIITMTVDMDSWQDNGGTVGSITYLPINSRLIVTHTPEVHARVAQLIDELQHRQVVSIRAKLVRLPESRVEQSTRLADGIAIWEGEVADLPMLAQVRFSGFDGQVQHAASGRSIGYFQSVQPIVAANAVGYQPSTSELQTGLILRATPILDVNSQSATVEIDAQYLLLGAHHPVDGLWQLAPAPASVHLRLEPHLDAATQQVQLEPHLSPTTQPFGAVQSAWLAVRGLSQPVLPDRLNVHRRSLETSLRVPVGQWVLIGTLGASDDGQATDEEPLHLLIRVDAGGGAQ